MRGDVDVDSRREAAIERELELAAALALAQRREVEEAQVERLLELVRAAAGEEHPRDVCLDCRRRRTDARSGERLRKTGDERTLGREVGFRFGAHTAILPHAPAARVDARQGARVRPGRNRL
jgi:hypothetical protein